MRSAFTSCAVLLAAAATTAYAQDEKKLPPVKKAALAKSITRKALSNKAHELEDIAYSTPNRNRVMGSEGHNLTVDWITTYLDGLSDYYTYEVQPFIALYSQVNGTVTVAGKDYEGEPFEYSPGGDIEGQIVAVDNFGCNASDYPAAVDGSIALISRGTCAFGDKSALAGSAGAVGAIIYNNIKGLIGGGTLGPPPNPLGDYVPTIGISKKDGNAILKATKKRDVSGEVVVNSDIRNITTFNVIAETIGGDHDNVVAIGAHTDSVFAGPGINDDGSGTISILETAIQLASYSVKNAVRFCWWSGEEFGLLGSTYYVDNLNDTQSEIDKIKLFLDFDMLASPNYIFGVYDGDGSTFDLAGPPGSAGIEKFFIDWFTARGFNTTPIAFDGRSDYQAFTDNGIPAGGIFTGAEELKTKKEFQKFGGVQGAPLDENYHQAGDNYTNLNFEAWVPMSRAVAAITAEYATTLESIPSKRKMRARDVENAKAARRAAEDEAFVWKGKSKMWKL